MFIYFFFFSLKYTLQDFVMHNIINEAFASTDVKSYVELLTTHSSSDLSHACQNQHTAQIGK